jgi:hypothetical protein
MRPANLPEPGSVRMIIDSQGTRRHGLILRYDDHHEMAFVRYLEYPIPDEWIIVGWIT